MVLGEVLGELEAGEFVVGRDTPHHPGALKVDEVAVGRAPWQLGQVPGDVPDADGMPRIHEQVDDGAPAGRVALVDAPKALFDQGVQVIGLGAI
jgi:hypothetical protein